MGWSVLEGILPGYRSRLTDQRRRIVIAFWFLFFGDAASHVGSYHMWDPRPGIELVPSALKVQS